MFLFGNLFLFLSVISDALYIPKIGMELAIATNNDEAYFRFMIHHDKITGYGEEMEIFDPPIHRLKSIQQKRIQLEKRIDQIIQNISK